MVDARIEVAYVSDCEQHEEFLELARPWLCDWELERLDRFRKVGDQVRLAASHLLVRWRVAEAVGRPARDVRLGQTDLKAPLIEPLGTSPLAPAVVSLSHTQGLLGCAVSCAPGYWVGFDVERSTRSLQVSDLLSGVLSPDEVNAWAECSVACSAAELRGLFFDLWTHKEALSKALGVGLQVSPRKWSFKLAAFPKGELLKLPSQFGNPEDWLFESGPRVQPHHMALAWRGDGQAQIDWLRIEPDQLIEWAGRT